MTDPVVDRKAFKRSADLSADRRHREEEKRRKLSEEVEQAARSRLIPNGERFRA